MPRPPDILVINPNSNHVLTARIRQVAQGLDIGNAVVEVAEPPDAPIAIVTAVDRAEVEPKIVSMISQAHAAGTSRFVLACFDDIAISAVRSDIGALAIDACEAGFIAAQASGARFSVVTTFDGAVDKSQRLPGNTMSRAFARYERLA